MSSAVVSFRLLVISCSVSLFGTVRCKASDSRRKVVTMVNSPPQVVRSIPGRAECRVSLPFVAYSNTCAICKISRTDSPAMAMLGMADVCEDVGDDLQELLHVMSDRHEAHIKRTIRRTMWIWKFSLLPFYFALIITNSLRPLLFGACLCCHEGRNTSASMVSAAYSQCRHFSP
jgi:hypothetical protein